MTKIWQMWSGVIKPEAIKQINDICIEFPPIDSSIGYGDGIKDNSIRVSEVRWVGSNDLLRNLVYDYAQEANRNAFGFDINWLKEIQYTIYKSEENAKYDWHQDTFWGNPSSYDRKISVVIQLSDPSEYEGGLFEFAPHWEQPDKEKLMVKGTVICFPSFIEHRVTPVTKGVRKSLVGWVEGPKFR